MNLYYLFVLLPLLGLADETDRGEVCSKSFQFRNHYRNLLILENCRIIDGDLEIALLELHVNELRAKTHMRQVVLPKLEIITGHLFLYRVNGLTSVGQLFPNLRSIKGLTLYENLYALVLYDMPYLEEVPDTEEQVLDIIAEKPFRGPQNIAQALTLSKAPNKYRLHSYHGRPLTISNRIPEQIKPEYLTTAWFIEACEEWFYLMTSRSPVNALSKLNSEKS
ncbi:hypothetical protein HUJ05_000260 [Dendroctonus ponderosae]|nr:hypothetical protein HUJ05_000260 [Dendroctonus ponderosae]